MNAKTIFAVCMTGTFIMLIGLRMAYADQPYRCDVDSGQLGCSTDSYPQYSGCIGPIDGCSCANQTVYAMYICIPNDVGDCVNDQLVKCGHRDYFIGGGCNGTTCGGVYVIPGSGYCEPMDFYDLACFSY